MWIARRSRYMSTKHLRRRPPRDRFLNAPEVRELPKMADYNERILMQAAPGELCRDRDIERVTLIAGNSRRAQIGRGTSYSASNASRRPCTFLKKNPTGWQGQVIAKSFDVPLFSRRKLDGHKRTGTKAKPQPRQPSRPQRRNSKGDLGSSPTIS